MRGRKIRSPLTQARTPWFEDRGAANLAGKTPLTLAEAPSSRARHDPRIADQPTTRLLLACPDRPGLIAAVSGFLADAGLNIVDADQHSSGEGRLFMRMVFDSPAEEAREPLYRSFEEGVAGPLEMEHRFAE